MMIAHLTENELKNFIACYSSLDMPIPYKELKIYPIYLKDYYNFIASYKVLCIDKNKVPDVEVIQMNYLDFLLGKLCSNKQPLSENSTKTVGEMYEEKLSTILSLVFRLDEGELFCRKTNNHYNLVIKDVEINSHEFEEIKRIILYENILDYSEEYVDPEVKQAMIDFYAVKNKGIVTPTLEDKMAVISAVNGLTKSVFKEMSIREFDMLFEKCKNLVDYQVMKIGEVVGNVKFEKPVEHWIYHKSYDPYAQAFSSYDDFKEKVNNV